MARRNPIANAVSGWFDRNFSDPAAVSLFMVLVLALVLIQFFGRVLEPFFFSIVIAYLLNSVVNVLVRCRIPYLFSVIMVFLVFIGLLISVLFGLLPAVIRQLISLLDYLPTTLSHGKAFFGYLMDRFPDQINQTQIQNLAVYAQTELAKVGQAVLSFSLESIPGIIELILYFVLVPFLVFFMLKDRSVIVQWLASYMPSERKLLHEVWQDVNHQLSNYIRGRVIEILVVGIASFVLFKFFGLKYSILLAVTAGLSVIIPYVGAVIAAFPILVIALLQWGPSADLLYISIGYVVIIFLDANILFPLLFSEALDLHPVAIILALLVFGAIWGFWGIFFAIPLASLVKAILVAWPRASKKQLS